MRKNTQKFLLLSTTLLMGGVTVLAAANSSSSLFQTFNVGSADCAHEHVEYYQGHTNDNTGLGYVEHWACCTCHTAWADEARTITIGNTQTDRANVDIETGFKVQWGASKMAPTYADDGVVKYTDNTVNIKATTGDDPYHFIETLTSKVIDSKTSAVLTITNKTTINTLSVQVLDVEPWKAIINTSVNKDEECEIVLPAVYWNVKTGFVFKDPSGVGGSGTIEFTLKFVTSSFVGPDDVYVYESSPVNSNLHGWASFPVGGEDPEYGVYKAVDITDAPSDEFDLIVNDTGVLPANTYATVKFALYNPTDLNIGLHSFMSKSNWDPITNQNLGTLKPGWNVLYINANNLIDSSMFFISLRLNLTNGGNVDGWKISKFVASPIKYEKTSFHFGVLTDSGEVDAKYGKIYNFSREDYYIGKGETTTFGQIDQAGLRALLTPGMRTLEFKVYNPLDTEVRFHVDGGKPWGGASSKTLAPKAWTVVSLTEIDFALNDTGTVYFYGASTDITGWQFTDIWATNVMR